MFILTGSHLYTLYSKWNLKFIYLTFIFNYIYIYLYCFYSEYMWIGDVHKRNYIIANLSWFDFGQSGETGQNLDLPAKVVGTYFPWNSNENLWNGPNPDSNTSKRLDRPCLWAGDLESCLPAPVHRGEGRGESRRVEGESSRVAMVI